MLEIKYDHNEIIVNMLKNAYVEKNSDVKADLFFELIYGIGTMIKSEEKSTKREEFQAVIFKTIESSFTKRGLELQQLLIRNITLPTSVKASIESKINAEQDAQKMTFVLQKEKQEAERKRVEAQGIADYQKILSTGLSDKQLQYEAIKAQKEIATSPNAKVIIMGSGKNPVIIGGN